MISSTPFRPRRFSWSQQSLRSRQQTQSIALRLLLVHRRCLRGRGRTTGGTHFRIRSSASGEMSTSSGITSVSRQFMIFL